MIMDLRSAEKSFKLIPEGHYVFKIMGVDDSKYEESGRITVRMQTVDGHLHFENYHLMKGGVKNDKAFNAWAYFVSVVTGLKGDALAAYDTDDMVGRYVQGDVVHRDWKGRDGETHTSESLQNIASASGFDDGGGFNIVDVFG